MDSTKKAVKQDSSALWTILVVVVFDLAMLIVSNMTDLFNILNRVQVADQPDGIFTYKINNANLIIIIAITLINVLAIYHIVSKAVFFHNLSSVDETGNISQGIDRINEHLINHNCKQLSQIATTVDSNKERLSELVSLAAERFGLIEDHLVNYNYNEDTIMYSGLSDVEQRIGANNKNRHNEIWIITNNFEENSDSDAGKKVRTAMLDNLATNVDYYYIVSKRYVSKMEVLSKKLSLERGNRILTGNVYYFVNDDFNFIPTPYYDIVLYIIDDPENNIPIEDTSLFYFCFSQKTEAKKCYYQFVKSNSEVWERIKDAVIDYKTEHEKQGMIMVI